MPNLGIEFRRFDFPDDADGIAASNLDFGDTGEGNNPEAEIMRLVREDLGIFYGKPNIATADVLRGLTENAALSPEEILIAREEGSLREGSEGDDDGLMQLWQN